MNNFMMACPKCHWANDTEVQVTIDKEGMNLVIVCHKKECGAQHYAQISLGKFSELVPVVESEVKTK